MVTRKLTSNTRALRLRKEMTAAEVALWQRLRRNQLGVRFQRQVAIGPFIVDFVCRSQRVIVELDGAGHHEVWDDYDLHRDAYLQERRYRILRFDNDDLAQAPEAVLDMIKSAIDVGDDRN